MRTLSFVALGFLVAACSSSTDDEVGTNESAIRNCPSGDPFCGDPPPKVACESATGQISASAPSVGIGGTVTVTWSSSLPARCSDQMFLDGIPVPASGSKAITLQYGMPNRLVLGTRALARAPVSVVYPSPFRIADGSMLTRFRFIDALNQNGITILLEDGVDLDLTGYGNLSIASNVEIASEAPLLVTTLPGGGRTRFITSGLSPSFTFDLPRGGTARSPRSPGPRIFTTQRVKALFDVNGSTNLKFSGFRLEGADQGIVEGDGDDTYARGFQLSACQNVDISNMEISGFSGTGIFIQDNVHQPTIADASSINIHDNFIHNNQHSQSNGYGIDVQPNSYALIEHNVFDNNRHSISSTGKPGSGYIATGNLQLKGGGHNDKLFNETVHVFDIHGDADCWYETSHSFLCGNAGTEYRFEKNAFQFTLDRAIDVRGTPTKSVTILNNVFANGSQDDAIGMTQGPQNIQVQDNEQYGYDSFNHYGVCDIDGDGSDDLFLATGVSWWFMSGAKRQWSFLGEHRERLSEVRLGDFDGDHRCDVLTQQVIAQELGYFSGAGDTWTSLGHATFNVPIADVEVGHFDAGRAAEVFWDNKDSGVWSVIGAGDAGWRPVQSSNHPISELRFGDFNGDGVTDVLGKSGGVWSISWNATQGWQPSASGLSDDLGSTFVGNVDGLPGDDLVRFVTDDVQHGHWEYSSGAQGPWQTFSSYVWPTIPPGTGMLPTSLQSTGRTYVGRFNGNATADILMVDLTRRAQVATLANRTFTAQGAYEY